jgi:prepilin-type N-terminal cleavage/methylation domain-containing protein
MKTKKGFTLIELLIVIAIIGILAAALLPTILNAPARGRDAARQGHMNQIVAALEAYNSDNGSYPNSAAAQAGACVGGGDVFDTGLEAYFAGGNAPQDPSGNRGTAAGGVTDCVAAGQYYYQYVGDAAIAEYILATVMEIEGNNNTDVPPADVAGGTDPDFENCTDGCDYYVLVK